MPTLKSLGLAVGTVFALSACAPGAPPPVRRHTRVPDRRHRRSEGCGHQDRSWYVERWRRRRHWLGIGDLHRHERVRSHRGQWQLSVGVAQVEWEMALLSRYLQLGPADAGATCGR